MTRLLKPEKLNFFKYKLLIALTVLSMFCSQETVLSFDAIVPELSLSYDLYTIPAITPHSQADIKINLNRINILEQNYLNNQIIEGIDNFLEETGLTKHTVLKKRLYKRFVDILSDNSYENILYSPFMALKIQALEDTFLQKPLETLVIDYFLTGTNSTSYNAIMRSMQKELVDYIYNIKVSYFVNNRFMFYLERLRAFEISA